MTDYFDNNNNKLEKGFYEVLSMGLGKGLIYFTGEYSSDGLPIFEKGNAIGDKNNFKREFDHFLTKRLLKLEKEEVNKQLNELKNKTSWIEEKLRE
jgi:hypothetical protein